MKYNKMLNNRNLQDSLTFLGEIGNNSIHCSFLDPQYRGLLDKMKYGNEGNRNRGRSLLKQMDTAYIASIVKETSRVLAPSGYLFLWVDKFHLCEGTVHIWKDATPLSLVDMIVWNKDRMGMGWRTRKQLEYLLILQKEPKRAKDTWFKKNVRDIWVEKIKDRKHPHQKPIGLIKNLIECIKTSDYNIVLDVCAGSYIVMTACRENNVDFLGCDIV